MDQIAPGFGIRIVAFMVMASTLGALNGFILTGGRFVMAVGRDHHLFSKLGEVSVRRGTPAIALIFTSFIALVLIWTKTLNSIVQYTAAVTYLFFVFIGIALILFRHRHPNEPLSFRVPGYPIVPLIFVFLYLALSTNSCWNDPKEAFVGFGIAVLGLIFFLVTDGSNRNQN